MNFRRIVAIVLGIAGEQVPAVAGGRAEHAEQRRQVGRTDWGPGGESPGAGEPGRRGRIAPGGGRVESCAARLK